MDATVIVWPSVVGQVAPPEATQVTDPDAVIPALKALEIAMFSAVPGPLFVTTIVNAEEVPPSRGPLGAVPLTARAAVTTFAVA